LGYIERGGQCFPTPENSIADSACSEHSNPTESPTGLQKLNESHSATKGERILFMNNYIKNKLSGILEE
jgi:hypothetical protein